MTVDQEAFEDVCEMNKEDVRSMLDTIRREITHWVRLVGFYMPYCFFD